MPTFNIVFTSVCQNGVMEPNEWQKKKNNKTTEYTQRITSQARSRVEKQEVNKRKVLEIEKRQFYKAMIRKQGALKIVKNHLFFKIFNS